MSQHRKLDWFRQARSAHWISLIGELGWLPSLARRVRQAGFPGYLGMAGQTGPSAALVLLVELAGFTRTTLAEQVWLALLAQLMLSNRIYNLQLPATMHVDLASWFVYTHIWLGDV